jgi:hypothetical protein
MPGFIVTGALGLTLGLWVGSVQVGSQTIPRPLHESGPEDIIKQRENNWTVGVAGGNMDGTYLRFADELGKKCSTTVTSCACLLPSRAALRPTCKTCSTSASMSRSRNRMSLKPVDFWTKMPSNAGLHLLPVPYSKTLADLYVAGEFTSADYPSLIPPGQRIDTIAVPSVLGVDNWPKNSDRYRGFERFTRYLFAPGTNSPSRPSIQDGAR